ncbi:PEP-CTERM sorting domain-containing protein [Rubellicoccus peritrichatus]|uniref:PEP-CTERM sorting domain-containing protein n=1 Tax=Rubellicoccus peritrichatus TaxID=3080537 RepID=A0AAQ3L633_9BACT|nr:PEP-CTERM sorting domain-containing protein [Puniceicoccus sp. CR14]WOO40154.1 PEP-CTERM sorting domain-containing protein [Puniceicoccus sp. CR14]
MRIIYPIVFLISALTTTQAATLFSDSFENPPDVVGNNPVGWTVSNPGIVITNAVASEGSQSVFIPNGPNRTTTQVGTVDLTGGGDLTFSFDYGVDDTFEPSDGLVAFSIDFGSGYQVIVNDMGAPDGVNSIYSGTTITLSDAAGSGASTFLGYTITIEESYYTGLGATTAQLRYIMNSGGGSESSHLDNVVVSTSIPEPSTYGLMMAIGGGLLVMIRRRIRQS